MPTAISIHDLIYNQAIAQGVPPAIALAVAQQESGTSQWTSSGNLVTGSSGEIGVFQLLPSSFPGVDSSDLNTNISTGIGYLNSLFQKYGNWNAALQAYNSGSPTGSPGYANSVLGIAGNFAPAVSAVAAAGGPSSELSVSDLLGSVDNSGTYLILGLLVGVAGLAWWLAD